MKTYSEEIVKAFQKWSNLSVEEPENETTKEYKNWKVRSNKWGNKFEKLCKEQGLNYIDVYSELLNPLLSFKIN